MQPVHLIPFLVVVWRQLPVMQLVELRRQGVYAKAICGCNQGHGVGDKNLKILGILL